MKTQTQRIFCGLCGHATETALFEHIRTEHKLTPPQYQEQCPGAPLFTKTFQDFVAKQGAHVSAENNQIHITRELFGVKMSCPVAPHPRTPVVDDGFHFNPDQAKTLVQSLAANDRILLVGPTGSGKSSLVAQLAARLGWPVSRVNLHGETSTTDMLGQLKVRDGSVVFQYGVLPTAIAECLDDSMIVPRMSKRQEGGMS